MRLTDTEWNVMNVLWDHHPATARDTLTRLGDNTDWAYATVKTILTRLADKGALSVEKRHNVSYFTPIVSREQARRSAVKSLLDRAFEGSVAPLIHFLMHDERMSRRDRATLESMFEGADRENRSDQEGVE